MATVDKSGIFVLTSNIDLDSSELIFPNDKPYILDLNGFTLTNSCGDDNEDGAPIKLINSVSKEDISYT